MHTVTLSGYYRQVRGDQRLLPVRGCRRCTAPYSSRSFHASSACGNPTYANYPVIHASVPGRRLLRLEGKARLPTEAEWEKAAQWGKQHAAYPWGDAAPTRDLVNGYVNGERSWKYRRHRMVAQLAWCRRQPLAG